MLLILAFSLVIASVFLIIYRKIKIPSYGWTLYKSYVGIMWCYAFYCKKRWHFTWKY